MRLTKSLAALLATSITIFLTVPVQASPLSSTVLTTDHELGLSPETSNNYTLAAVWDPATCRCVYEFLYTNYEIWLPVDLYNEENQWGRNILQKVKKECGAVRILPFS